jgi:hypothetical protein
MQLLVDKGGSDSYPWFSPLTLTGNEFQFLSVSSDFDAGI